MPDSCDSMDSTLPGSSVHGILQARMPHGPFIEVHMDTKPNPITIFAQCCLHAPLLSDQIRSDQSLSRVRLFATPWITARQASLSITNSQSSLKLTSIKSVMPYSHLILVVPFSSCPQSLPASESFPTCKISPKSNPQPHTHFLWLSFSFSCSSLSLYYLGKKLHSLIPTCDNKFCSNIEVFFVIITQWFRLYQKL